MDGAGEHLTSSVKRKSKKSEEIPFMVTTYETTPVITTVDSVPSLQSSLANEYNRFELQYKAMTDQLQKLEEKAAKAQEALEKEEKLRKEVEELNAKLLAEKTALLDSLSGEKGALQEFQEKANKLQAQKSDLENQLRVSIKILTKCCWLIFKQKKYKIKHDLVSHIFNHNSSNPRNHTLVS